jgi:hypothetical protein
MPLLKVMPFIMIRGGNMTEQEMKAFIDTASYEQLLQMNRFEPLGSKWMCGEVGQHFAHRFAELKSTMTDGELVGASKAVGWD